MTYELCGGQNRLNTDPQIEKYLFPMSKENDLFRRETNGKQIQTYRLQITHRVMMDR